MLGDGGDEAVVGDGAGAVGDEEAWGAEAEGARGELGGGYAGRLGYGEVLVFAEGDELLAIAAEEDRVGGFADVFDGEAEMDLGGCLLELGLADGLKELCSVAEKDRGRWRWGTRGRFRSRGGGGGGGGGGSCPG